MPRSTCRKACGWQKLLHSSLENRVRPSHHGKSSPGQHLVCLTSPCPSCNSLFPFPGMPPSAPVGESPPLSGACAPLFSRLHLRKEPPVPLRSHTKELRRYLDQIRVNYNMVPCFLAKPEDDINLRSQCGISSPGCVLARRGRGRKHCCQ